MLKNLIKKTELKSFVNRLKRQKNKIVFTNGVFDIIHRGHVEYLTKARTKGDILIVGLNSDISVRKLKGKNRPINKQADRAAILLALKAVDYVTIFSEETPEKLIKIVRPDVLAKGADYRISEIVGANFVKESGGKVIRIALTKSRSTSRILKELNKS